MTEEQQMTDEETISTVESDGRPKRSLWDKANLLARHSFIFVLPLIDKGYRGQLNSSHLCDPPSSYRTCVLGHKLELKLDWNPDRPEEWRPNLLSALLRSFWPQLILIFLLDFISKCIFAPLQILAFGWLLTDSNSISVIATNLQSEDRGRHSHSKSTPNPLDLFRIYDLQQKSVVDLVLLLVATWFTEIFAQASLTLAQQIGLKCRVATSYLVYQKSLRLEAAQTNSGSHQRPQLVTSLFSSETKMIEDSISLISKLVTIPTQVVVVVFLWGFFFVGLYPALGSLVTGLVLLVSQAPIGRALTKIRGMVISRTQDRIKQTARILMSFRFIKEQAWEESFRQKIHKARRRELNLSTNIWIIKAINSTIHFGSSKLMAFVAIIIYTAVDHSIDPSVLFVTILVAETLRLSLTIVFPYSLSSLCDLVEASSRLDNFLGSPEKSQNSSGQLVRSVDPQMSPYSLVMNEIFVTWDRSNGLQERESACIIRNLSLSLRHKELVLVIGHSGGGKSTLLMSILGEIPLENGRIQVNGKTSYAPQDAWIFDGTIRENILIGNSYRECRYKEVMRVCGLDDELQRHFPDGDKTAIGLSGEPLSDSLRSRINLARAIYQQADLYLLDDPFAQLSSTEADEIFLEAVQTFLRNKTVILVSSRLRYIAYASSILVLDRDKSAAFGAFNLIRESETFKSLKYKPPKQEEEEEEEKPEETTKKSSKKKLKIKVTQTKGTTEDSEIDIQSNGSLPRLHSKSPSSASFDQMTRERKWRDRQAMLSRIQSKTSKYSGYMYYITQSTNWLTFVLFLAASLGAQMFYNFIDYLLSLWSDVSQRHELQRENFKQVNFLDYLKAWEWSGWYAITLGVFLLILIGRHIVLAMIALAGSTNIHRELLDSLTGAPVSEFDFRSMGLMLNQLKRAISNVDESIPVALSNLIYSLLACAATFLLILAIDFTNIVAILIFCSLTFQLAASSLSAIVQLKQIEQVKGFTSQAHLTTTLAGLPVIRSLRAQEKFISMFAGYLDSQTSASFALMSTSRFLLLFTDLLSLSLVTAIICTKMFYSIEATNLSLSSLLMSQALLLPVAILLTTLQLIDLENIILDVEYLKTLSQCQSETTTRFEKRPKMLENLSETETFGEIRFIELTMRISESSNGGELGSPRMEPVLKRLNITIGSGEKVAILGPLGSGKSSISGALLRLYPYECGHVEISRIDTRRLSLTELRSSVSLVPSNPRLFDGSLRENLDPFGEHSDGDLWAALESVNLISLYKNSSSLLDGDISQQTRNPLNVTQRQLLYLARAILRKNKILIFEESSSSSLDAESEMIFESILASYFAQSTVIVVAHRVSSVAFSDRILVLDRGEMREFATPHELANDRSSLFNALIEKQLSKDEATKLRQIIEENHRKKVQGIESKSEWDFRD